MSGFIVVLTLLSIGYFVGTILERKHYKSIIEREKTLRDILVFDNKYPAGEPGSGGQLVRGNVVVSVDYFKRFVASLRQLVGGRLSSYESLLDRGRREAVLRMKEEAKRLGANHIFNVRFETASISQGAQNALGSVEVLVYGSAVKL